MNLPVRLFEIANMIPDGSSLIDVGADHGLLEAYLLANKKNIRIVAVENKKGPYTALSTKLRGAKNLSLSYSSGLQALRVDYETIVIAGMGGINIVNILNEYPKKVSKVERIIVDAHSDIELVRRCVVSYGFKIEKEKIVYEGEIFYVLISFVKTKEQMNYTEDEFKFGYKIYEDELWNKYREKLVFNLDNDLEKIKNVPSAKEKFIELNEIKKRLLNYGKN